MEGGCLLIVDDEEINRAVLANLFQEEYHILQAADGLEALEVLQRGQVRVDALLLDVVMPRLDGIQLLHRLSRQGWLRRIPVFLITADRAGATMEEAYRLGVMDVILKPVVPYLVRRRVNSVVELFQARRRLGAEVERQRDQLLRQAQELAEMGMGMVEALAAAIEFRSGESGEHVRRIRAITCHLLSHTALGEGLSREEIQLIGVGAITHDVGKISIPDGVLNKRGPLTPEEYALMQTHTLKGAELLARIPQMRAHRAYPYAYDIALHHHERWDGNGYPHRLTGAETPIWTQIVALADVYDALVSRRCYKDALAAHTAVEMIRSGQCGAFQPKLLDCFQQAEPVLRRYYPVDKGE